MPWSADDAKRHTKKARSPAARRQWAAVANAALKRGLPEGEAVREANSVLKHRSLAAARRKARQSFHKAARGSILES